MCRLRQVSIFSRKEKEIILKKVTLSDTSILRPIYIAKSGVPDQTPPWKNDG
jgi:hypothetical protein